MRVQVYIIFFILFVSDDSTSNLRVRIINKDFHPSGKKDENKIIIKKSTT